MTIDAWPEDLPHGIVRFEPFGGGRGLGSALAAPPAVGASTYGPIVRGRLTNLPIADRARLLAARALQSRLAGGASPVMLPVCVSGLTPQQPGGAALEAAIGADAAAGDDELVILLAGGYRPLRGGEWFSLDHDDADVGRRAYMVVELVDGSDPAAPVVRIVPRLRAELLDEAVIDFLTPTAPMRLVDGFELPTRHGRFSGVEAMFEEWFEASPSVQVSNLRDLTLSPATIEEASPEDTFVGRLFGTTSGSTVTLEDDAGGRFKLVDDAGVLKIYADTVATDYGTATSHDITVRETLAGRPNSPHDTVLTIAVTAIAAAAPVFVQEKGVNGTYHITLDAAPTDGNYLFACAYNDTGPPSVDAGWTSVASQAVVGSAPAMRIARKGPCSGELAAQIPFSSGPSGNRGGVMVVEVSGITDVAAAVQAVAFATAPTSGSATSVVNANTTHAETLAFAFSGWESSVALSFTITLTSGWSGAHVSGPNTDTKAGVFGRKSVTGAGVTVTATTTTGVASYGLTGALLLLGPTP